MSAKSKPKAKTTSAASAGVATSAGAATSAGVATPPAPAPSQQPQAAPSLSYQKTFVRDKSTFLTHQQRVSIFNLLVMEDLRDVTREVGAEAEIDVDLDELEKRKPDVLTHIYNIVRTRCEALSRPARHE